jgi:hypothetical protein
MSRSATKCPECGGKSEVKDSRPTESGDIRRRRECGKCGDRWTTYEVHSEDYRSRSVAGDLIDGLARIGLEARRLAKEMKQ